MNFSSATTTTNGSSKTAAATSSSSFSDTPLGSDDASYLLEGLEVYQVNSSGDGHPLAVYGIQSSDPKIRDNKKTGREGEQDVLPILLLHGRTWSSVPVYHLHLNYPNTTTTAAGGETESEASPEQSRSLMESLLEKGLQPYAMDFRGFGGTPYDKTGYVEPNRCVEDCEDVLRWISERHGMLPSSQDDDVNDENYGSTWPSLLGWSQGALVAQLIAQRQDPCISKLILYGSIYDPLLRYSREPLYAQAGNAPPRKQNTFDDAVEDFTIEGTIPPEPARKFAEAALITDPVKAAWRHLYQFNNCDPARVHVPTLVVGGDQDPYAPLHVQQELFTNLGRESDRTWSILTGCDHAVHLLEDRVRLINIVVGFVKNVKRSEKRK